MPDSLNPVVSTAAFVGALPDEAAKSPYTRYPAFMELEALRKQVETAASPVVRDLYQSVLTVAEADSDVQRNTQFVNATEGVAKMRARMAQIERNDREQLKFKKTFIKLAAENRGEFSAADREVIRYVIFTHLHGLEAMELFQQSESGAAIKEAFKNYIERNHITNHSSQFGENLFKEQLAKLPPYEMCQIIHMYGMEGEYQRALAAGKIPRGLKGFYKNWAAKNAKLIKDYAALNASEQVQAISETTPAPVTEIGDAGTNLSPLTREYIVRRNAATSPTVFKLYDTLLALSGSSDGIPPPETAAAYTLVESLQKQAAPNLFLMGLATDKYAELAVPDRMVLKDHFKPLFAASKPLSKDQVGTDYVFFDFSIMYGFEKELKDLIARKMIPDKLAMAYPDWEKTNENFVVTYRNVNLAAASGAFPSVTLSDADIVDLLTNYEERVGGANGLKGGTDFLLQSDYTHDLPAYRAARDAATTPLIKKFYDIMVRYTELALSDDGATPLIADHTASEIRQIEKDVVIHLLKFAEENYARLGEKEREIVPKHLDTLFTPSNNVQHIRDNKARLNLIPAQVLFRYVHLYGREEIFGQAIERKEVPASLRLAYPAWLKANEGAFAAAEPQALAEVLEKYNRHIAAMHAEPAYDIKKLHAILALTASFGENIGEPAQREELLSYLSALERKDLETSPHKLLAEYVHDHPRTAEGESFKEVYSVLSTLFIAEAHAAYKAAGLMTAEQFPPHLLFATIESFQFRDAFAAAGQRGEMPGDLLEWYGHWKGVGTALDGEHAGTRVLLDDFAYHRDRATHDAEKKIYETFAILMRNQAGMAQEKEAVAYTPAEIRQRQENSNLFILSLAVTHADEMSTAAQYRLKNFFAGMLEYRRDAIEGLNRNPQFQPHQLFQFAHLYGIADKLEAELQTGRLPDKIKAAYPGWKTSNTSFIARCETRLAGHDAPETSAVPNQAMSPNEQLKYILNQMASLRGIAQTSSGSDLNARLLAQEKALLKLAQLEENYDCFTTEERENIRAQLRANFHFYPERPGEERRMVDGKSKPLSQLRNAMTKDGLDKLAGPDLFRAIHIYGVAEDFTSMNPRNRSPKVYLSYLGWAKLNQEFTNRWLSRHVVEQQLGEFEARVKGASTPEVAKLYTMLAEGLRGGATAPGFTTDFCTHVATHDDKFSDDDRMFVQYQLKSWINPPGKPTDKQRGFWSGVDVTAVIMAAGTHGLGKDMDEARTSGFMPDEVALQYWLSLNPSPVREEVAVTFAEAMPTRETIVDSRLTQIDVDHAMVVSGNKTESMGPGQSDRDDILGGESDKGVQFRTETLFTALLKDGASGVKHITVRWDKREAGAEDDGKAAKKAPLPYNLVDIEMQDGSRSRVVVCDHFGKMTYVCRDTAEWNETDVLQISDLRKDPKVWTAIHISDKQWVSLIQKVLYTPIDALEVDPKTRNSRWGLKGVLTETFVQAVVATGALPPTSNATVVKEGPLAGRFRWSTLYNAANAGDISELPKGTTWRTLYAELTKEKGEYPALKEFMGRTEKITAGDIHVACTRFQQEFDLAVQAEFYDDIKVRGLSGHAVDLALRFGQVAGWEAYLPEGAPAPQDLEDFVVRSGLAERDGMQLVAA